MQHSDERPPTSGRPSLLSLDQQAEADRHRILSGLESKPASTTAGGEKSRKGMLGLVVAGAVVLALGAGAGLWLVSEGEKEIVMAGTAPLPATPAPPVALATEPPVVRGTADDVSAAAILEDAPLVATPPQPTPDKKQADDELTRMFEQGTPAAKPAAPQETQQAAESVKPKPVATASARPAKPVRPVAKAAPKKPVVKARPEASNVAPRPRAVPAGAKKKAEARAVPVDNDVALLAALVAHSKATQPKSTGAAAKLRQCKSLDSVAEANQCRARVCAGAKNEPECKSSSLNRASSEG